MSVLRENSGFRTFLRDEKGASLVELAMVLALFLLILFGLIDYGRYAFHYVTSERAVHLAARIAVVRPPACAGLPETNARGSYTGTEYSYGSDCKQTGITGLCSDYGTISCVGDTANPTVAEIWPRLDAVLPNGSTPQNVRFAYTFDEELGFLGGPAVPIVTVELQNVRFNFITPLGKLAELAMGTGTSSLEGGTDDPEPGIRFPSMSVSLPAEDLNHGNEG